MSVNFSNVAGPGAKAVASGKLSRAPRSLTVHGAPFRVTRALSGFCKKPLAVEKNERLTLRESGGGTGFWREEAALDAVTAVSSGMRPHDVLGGKPLNRLALQSGIFPSGIEQALDGLYGGERTGFSLLFQDLCFQDGVHKAPLPANWAALLHGTRRFSRQEANVLFLANVFFFRGEPYMADGPGKNIPAEGVIKAESDIDEPCMTELCGGLSLPVPFIKMEFSGTSAGRVSMFIVKEVQVRGLLYYQAGLLSTLVTIKVPYLMQDIINSDPFYDSVRLDLPGDPGDCDIEVAGFRIVTGTSAVDPSRRAARVSAYQ